MIGIYKLTNKINGKSYIGQSVCIEKRFKNHINTINNVTDHCYDYPIYRALRKYGINNFDFEIIEECKHDELDEREKYWISVFDTLRDGYNQTFGGDGVFNRLDYNKLDSISNDLKDTDIRMADIAIKYDISEEMVQGINTGRYWNRSIEYPIRKRKPSKKVYCCDCGKEISKGALLCVECHQKRIRANRPSRNELENLIYKESFEAIGRLYGVTGKAVTKWCLSYGLPSTRKEIKEAVKRKEIA